MSTSLSHVSLLGLIWCSLALLQIPDTFSSVEDKASNHLKQHKIQNMRRTKYIIILLFCRTLSVCDKKDSNSSEQNIYAAISHSKHIKSSRRYTLLCTHSQTANRSIESLGSALCMICLLAITASQPLLSDCICHMHLTGVLPPRAHINSLLKQYLHYAS